MEFTHTRYQNQPSSSSPSWGSPRSEGAKMPALTLRQSSGHHLPGPTSLLDTKFPDHATIPRSESRPRSESAQMNSSPVQLPPIREIVDFARRGERVDAEYRVDGSPPSYGKRRRAEEDEAGQWRESSYPRLGTAQRSPQRSPRMMDRSQSNPTANAPRRPSAAYSTPEQWSSRSSPYQSTQSLPPLQHPPTFVARSDMRQPILLPSLTSLTQGHDHPSAIPSNFSEYSLDASRQSAAAYPPPRPGAYDTYAQASPVYGYQQQRGQSFSGPSSYTTGHDRSPFSSAPNAMFPGAMHPYGPEGQDRENESRQRKRRGNLPKETTDKLRAWFMAHLQHPYPTEDEKQELMRQTGLQMNQISNWFINARRRQLPAMINNARAESDARTARSGEQGLGPISATDYGEESDRRSMRDSDGEGSLYEDEFDPRQQQQRGGGPGHHHHGKTESI